MTSAGAPAAVLRRGTLQDARACLDLLWASATDLGRRHGTTLDGSADDWWAGSGPLHRFLADHAAEWWLAEDPTADGRLIGYARSIERGGLLELTEFFVAPGEQSRGVGRALLERAFPLGRGEVRSIIATTDVRALTRYYRADTIARFPYFTLTGPPSADASAGILPVPEPLTADGPSLDAVVDIERAVLGFPRGEAELRWLLESRDGWLYRDDGPVVGFAFVGRDAGPIAAFEPRYLPGILLHVESQAAARGAEKLELEVPAPNATAIRHLLERGFRIDPWINLLMSNKPFGQFDRYIGYSPPIIL